MILIRDFILYVQHFIFLYIAFGKDYRDLARIIEEFTSAPS